MRGVAVAHRDVHRFDALGLARAETTNIESYATPLKHRGYDLTTLRTRLGVDAGLGV